MTKEERLAGNEIIARYIGKSFHLGHISDHKEPLSEEMNKRWLKYHRDWNELIPVAKKCIDNFHDKRGDIYNALHKCDIQALWEAIVIYIQWLKANKEEVDCWMKYRKVYWNNETKKCEADKYVK